MGKCVPRVQRWLGGRLCPVHRLQPLLQRYILSLHVNSCVNILHETGKKLDSFGLIRDERNQVKVHTGGEDNAVLLRKKSAINAKKCDAQEQAAAAQKQACLTVNVF